MNIFKKQCVELRGAGYTLTEIVKITNRPKTSVYTHIRNIPLSTEKVRLIKAASSARALGLALNRKGVSDKNFIKFDQWSKNIVSLLSHLIFDGTINKASCVYNNRNIVLVSKVEKCMKEIYQYEPKKWVNSLTGVSRISYHNVALAAFLKLKSEELLKNICRLSIDLKREFIKSFFDDEGCIDFRPKRNLRQIRGYQKNVSILLLIQRLLKDFGIQSRVVMPNEVVISGRDNLQKFQKEINFLKGVSLNENRTNSIWKKPIEKRVLLKQAIDSYKI